MELTKINPKEYGVKPESASEIEIAFTPKIDERNALAEMYKVLITKDLTEELSEEAGNLRRKLVKVRTGMADIHKAQKAYFLASGKFVDAWKNKETLPVTQMEEKLAEIEKHAENLEKERMVKLKADRIKLLEPYNVENVEILGLDVMSEPIWTSFLSGVKSDYKAKIEAEKKAEEERVLAEKKSKEEAEEKRKKEIAEAEARAKEKAEKEAQIKIEEEKKRAALAEAKAIEDAKKAEEERKAEAIRVELREKEAKKKAEAEKQSALKAAEEKAKQLEKEKAEKLEAEKQAEIEANLNKGDAAKVIDLKHDLTDLKSKYVFKSAKNKKMYSDVCDLLDKVYNHIK